jgi:tetratricopeptide (TPR) repeat protein
MAATEQGVSDYKQSVQAHVYLGLAYEKMGRPKDALLYLRRAYAMKPSAVGLKESIQALEENMRTHVGGSQNSVHP